MELVRRSLNDRNMSCFKVKVVTHFLKIFKIIQIIYERNDGANKMQIEQR